MSAPAPPAMRWSERQRAMLREMGIHLWAPETATETADASAATIAAPASASSGSVARSVAREAAPAAGAMRPPAGRVGTAAAPAELRDPSPAAPRWPGLAPADWLVVAELDAGDPQQEQLLENMLRAIGAGVVAPARERRAAFFALGHAAGDGAAAPAPDALSEALALVAPRCVLAFGRAAATALLGDDVPLGALRGRVHVRDGVPVVVTFSVAFLLRHPAEKAKAWADLCLAVGALSP